MLRKKSNVFWCTGMSGVGKSTLSIHVKTELEKRDFSVTIIDGDYIRKNYKMPLGFSRKDIEKNNMLIAKFAEEQSLKNDVTIVSIISPIDKIRKQIRKMLSPNFYLVYLTADIDALVQRDPKGLYKKANENVITDLIGYSNKNLYDVPLDADLVIDTSQESSFCECQKMYLDFIIEKI